MPHTSDPFGLGPSYRISARGASRATERSWRDAVGARAAREVIAVQAADRTDEAE